ncbi:MAG: hypothetical protein NZL95_06940 [Chitinophagales bacterium]|nr:hypothetical protein [Chitinophagales bacterium]MDW8428273.1 hypothetical protein [Chitinophagales bacterium]
MTPCANLKPAATPADVAGAAQWLTQAGPAQTLLVLRPDATQIELLKYMLADMFFREELALDHFETSRIHASRLGYARVSIGAKFQARKARLHEMVALFPFYKRPDKKIVFRHWLQMVLQTTRSEANLKWKLMQDENYMQGLFEKSWLHRLFGGMRLSAEGKKLQKNIIYHFNEIDQKLAQQLKHGRQQALHAYHSLAGNILLLNSFRFELVALIGAELARLDDELETGTSVVPGT